ncbi:MAG: ROK family protein [Candidatus Paceibacterota bacterium]
MQKIYLGVDVGGTKIKAILLNIKSGRRFGAFEGKTPQNFPAFNKFLEKGIKGVIKKTKISGIGIGLPGVVKDGKLLEAPHLHFLKNWNVRKFLSRFRVPVKVENDSRCFLVSESILGAGKNKKNIAVLTIGTGIGGGLMINGKIYRGGGSAGEFGHMIINREKTLEELGAKKAFLKMGDRSKVIGAGIADIINAFDPDVVILGGGGVFHGGMNMEKVKKVARKNIISPVSKKTKIVRGKLGESAQAIGAALLFKVKL